MNNEDEQEFEELGYVMVAGHRLPILGTHFCQGSISVRILVPQGFPGCVDGVVTMFGHDDMGIMQIPETINLPAVPPSMPYGMLELQLAGGAR